MSEHIKTKAEEFIDIYAKAVGSGMTQDSTQHAKAMLDCYVPQNFIAFSHGTTSIINQDEASLARTKAYVERWVAVGAGVDYKLVSYRIEVVSGGSALCHITWSVVPPVDCEVGGWEWENVYFFRLPPGHERGYWEGVISDNEIARLLQRFPGFMTGMNMGGAG